jgi:hypothetical protein
MRQGDTMSEEGRGDFFAFEDIRQAAFPVALPGSRDDFVNQLAAGAFVVIGLQIEDDLLGRDNACQPVMVRKAGKKSEIFLPHHVVHSFLFLLVFRLGGRCRAETEKAAPEVFKEQIYEDQNGGYDKQNTHANHGIQQDTNEIHRVLLQMHYII